MVSVLPGPRGSCSGSSVWPCTNRVVESEWKSNARVLSLTDARARRFVECRSSCHTRAIEVEHELHEDVGRLFRHEAADAGESHHAASRYLGGEPVGVTRGQEMIFVAPHDE